MNLEALNNFMTKHPYLFSGAVILVSYITIKSIKNSLDKLTGVDSIVISFERKKDKKAKEK